MFRPLAWAYLHDRLVLNANVTALNPAPVITSVTPNPIIGNGVITVHGQNFQATPMIELVTEGDPTPNPVLSETWVDAQTVTGSILSFLVPPGTYDVHMLSPDDQVTVLVDGLVVQ